MADVKARGVDQTTGEMRTIGSSDTLVDGSGAEIGGGLWTLLGSVTGTNVSSLDLSNLLSDTYETYLLIGQDVKPASSSRSLRMRFETGGTTMLTASKYQSSMIRANSNSAGVSSTVLSGGSYIDVTQTIIYGNANTGTGGFRAWIYRPTANRLTMIQGKASYVNADISTVLKIGHSHFSGFYGSDDGEGGQTYTDITGLQLFASIGNVDGTLKLYGLAA
jgi:hypothetical protein